MHVCVNQAGDPEDYLGGFGGGGSSDSVVYFRIKIVFYIKLALCYFVFNVKLTTSWFMTVSLWRPILNINLGFNYNTADWNGFWIGINMGNNVTEPINNRLIGVWRFSPVNESRCLCDCSSDTAYIWLQFLSADRAVSWVFCSVDSFFFSSFFWLTVDFHIFVSTLVIVHLFVTFYISRSSCLSVLSQLKIWAVTAESCRLVQRPDRSDVTENTTGLNL